MSDRVELTAAEREELAEAGGTTIECRCEFCLNTEAAAESIVAARVAALTAERDTLRIDLRTCERLSREAADAARAELAAANARCAELEAELKVREGPWRDSLVAWNTYNEAYGYHGDLNRPVMDAFRTGFDAGRAEPRSSVDWKAIAAQRDALQETLDRVTALPDEWEAAEVGVPSPDTALSGNECAAALRAALRKPRGLDSRGRSILNPNYGIDDEGGASDEHR